MIDEIIRENFRLLSADIHDRCCTLQERIDSLEARERALHIQIRSACQNIASILNALEGLLR